MIVVFVRSRNMKLPQLCTYIQFWSTGANIVEE